MGDFSKYGSEVEMSNLLGGSKANLSRALMETELPAGLFPPEGAEQLTSVRV